MPHCSINLYAKMQKEVSTLIYEIIEMQSIKRVNYTEVPKTYITLGGDTESSNPSRLMFSINIPEILTKGKISNTNNKLQTNNKLNDK